MGFDGQEIRARLEQAKRVEASANQSEAPAPRACPRCLTAACEEAAFCLRCGEPLAPQAATAAPRQPQAVRWGQHPKEVWIAGLRNRAVVLAVMLAGYLLLPLFNRAPTPAKAASAPTAQRPAVAAPQKTAAQLAQEEAERARQAAARKAQQEAEEAQCRQSLQCWGDRNSLWAATLCDDAVERLAKYSHEWTDGWLDAKFTHFRWKDQGHGVMTYIGDKIRFQNGFGAWQPHVYECDLDTHTHTVLAARAQPGRLP
jgi:hypothetical protein